MTLKTKIILAAGGVFLIAFLFVIAFGKGGAVDLYQLRLERDRVRKVNLDLQRKNQALSKTIERLQHDPDFIENIARTELGMTARDEVVILKKKP
ncbi:MAG: septum formation initiator family protein [Deltaproteobacteria bacterium]|nr:septum formation initiator family protein [Deltaproteobacteria bacterium]